jgi:biotin carboxylase
VVVVFVASDLQPTTLRFMAGVLGQPGVKMGLITSASTDQLPERVRERLVALERIADARDPDQIVEAIRRMPDALRHPQRLLGSADELVVPLAHLRGRMDIEGMRGNVARGFREADRMRDRLAAAGLPIAHYARAESVQDALAFGTDIGYYPLVVKPNEGANRHQYLSC